MAARPLTCMNTMHMCMLHVLKVLFLQLVVVAYVIIITCISKVLYGSCNIAIVMI